MALRLCEQVVTTHTQVNDNILNVKDLFEQVLHRVFQMNLPASFKKVVIPPRPQSSMSSSRLPQEMMEKETAATRRSERTRTELVIS